MKNSAPEDQFRSPRRPGGVGREGTNELDLVDEERRVRLLNRVELREEDVRLVRKARRKAPAARRESGSDDSPTCCPKTSAPSTLVS